MRNLFDRKAYAKMLQWKAESKGTTALLIKGVRRVGKSTLVETFAKKEYDSHIFIDFSIAPPEIHEIFNNISDLNSVFLKLQAYYNVSLKKRRSVIVFDEVQRQPLARQAIKHLVKDGRYDYIETGSLISIRQNVKDIVIPSEEYRISLNPLDFEEFMWAIGKKMSFDYVRSCFEEKKPLGDVLHRRLMQDFRLYVLVGGMPQAVNAYLDKNDFTVVDNVKRSILELYDDDFMRIDGTGRSSRMFKAVPQQLASNLMRYRIGNVLGRNSRPSLLEDTIINMGDSMTVSISYHANDPNVGMALHGSLDRFKLYLADTGLFVTLAFMDKDMTENVIYKKMLSNKLSADLGYVYENVVAQMLRAAGHNNFYYTFPKDDTHLYEIDFLITKGSKVLPIEVKSSGYKTHKSLDAFSEKFSDRVLNKILIYTKDLRCEGDVLYIPVYMTGLL